MSFHSHNVFMLVSLLIALEARHCTTRIATNQILFSDKVEEKPGDDDVKVELPEDCGRFEVPLTRQHHRIHSGYNAKSGQFPSFVQLYLPDIDDPVGYSLCGGTIITSKHILTAAHCITDKDVRKTVVSSGLEQYKLHNKNFESNAERICESSKYKTREKQTSTDDGPFNVFDVAIVKIKDNFVFSETIQPACLPDGPLAGDRQAFSLGLGSNYSVPFANNSTEPETLQVLPVMAVNCTEDQQHKSIMCSKANNPDYMGVVCEGDSGGPVMALDDNGRQTVYGLHSFGPAYCMDYTEDASEQLKDAFYLSFNTDVYNIRQEIDKLLEECA